jgi:cytochrome c peroxidase
MKLSISARYFRQILTLALLLVVGLCVWLVLAYKPPAAWTEAEKATINSLSLTSLPPLPVDRSNAVSTDIRAVEMGHALFFDSRLSVNQQISCATCHRPELRFTDGLDKARALGESRRNTPSIVGLAYSPWLYWDGRRDSLWAQALSPLEDPQEQGNNRMAIARLVTEDVEYSKQYQALFGELPDFSDRSRFPENAGPELKSEWYAAWEKMQEDDQILVNQTFANVGKAIAAYERILLPAPSRFDAYAQSLVAGDLESSGDIFSNDEIKGLRLFIGEARCMECHNGPLFTNFEFHNTGIISYPGDLPDRGRVEGVREVRSDSFNCQGVYSELEPEQCLELIHAREGVELIGALKTPSLRNLEGTAPYMHKGQIKTLAQTLDHYNRAPFAMIGHNEAEEILGMLSFELKQLEAFLDTLQAPIDANARWLEPPQ